MTAPLTRSRPTRQEAASAETSLPPALRRVAISVVAVLATLGLGRAALHRFDTPVRELAITGKLANVQPDEVRAVAAPLIDGKLFQLDLDGLRLAVERLPWVAHVRIDRQWPARLGVRITEREPFARWGENEALSTEGIVFAPGSVLLPATLPLLGGEAARAPEVMATYTQLVDRLAETPLTLAGLTLDARGEWIGSTHGGISLRFGRSNPVEQVQRLKNIVLPALSRRLESVARIDLRYANGFAVGWKSAAEAAAAEKTFIPDAPAPSAAAEGVVPGATP